MWNHSFYERPSAKVFSTKFCEIRNAYVACIFADAMRMRTCVMHQYIIIGVEQFSLQNFDLFQNAKGFHYNYDTIKIVVRQRRTVKKSGTAFAVPAGPSTPPLL